MPRNDRTGQTFDAGEFVRDLMPGGWYRAAFGLTAITGIALCFIPLFSIIGYESAAFYGVLWGLLCPYLTLHAWRAEEREPPLSDIRRMSPLWDFLHLFVRHLALLVVPLLILWVNSLRVQNCDLGVGLAFWALIPPVSILVGQTIAVVTLAAFPYRRWWQRGIVTVTILGTFVAFGLWLALEPPIVGFNAFLGYFSGSIYDEALSVPPALVWYRFMLILGVFALLLLVEGLWRRGQPKRAYRPLIGAVIVAAVFAALWVNRRDFGIDLTRGYIAEELGGRVETEHFVIHYPLREPFVSDVDRLVEDHEYRYAEMEEFLGTDPVALHGEKVRSFVYPGRDEKGRLMGARRTLVAKIWLGEVHILWRHYGDHMLVHELAHIFSEPFATGPLRLSTRWGVGINMGLVEGLATAADWPPGELTPHEASAALRDMDRAPDIRGLVGASGFWTQSSGRAYILMGSFVRYLIDEYGVDKFRRAYGHGEFAAVYGKSADQLVEDWENFVDAIELTDDDRDRARYRFDRPSIFEKVCARTIAELQVQAQRQAHRGDVSAAREIYQQILGFDPDNLTYRLRYARFLASAGDYEAAAEQARALLGEELAPVQRARAYHLLGDALWQREPREGGEDLAAARDAYSECLEQGLPLGTERLIEVKLRGVELPQASRELVREYLLEHAGDPISTFFPTEFVRRNPHSALANYLLGRRLLNAREWERSLEFLEPAHHAIEPEVLRLEAVFMLGKARYFTDDLDGAAPLFELLTQSDRSYYVVEGREWLGRIDWARRNR